MPDDSDDVYLERIRQLRQRIPALTFDLIRPGLYVIIVPGRAEPFQNASLATLVTDVEEWLAIGQVETLLFGDPWRTE